MKRKKVLCFTILSIITALCTITGCDKVKKNISGSDNKLESEPDNTSIVDNNLQDNQEQSEVSHMSFVDVHGNEYEMDILSSVPKHNYDYSYLSRDGKFYTYSDTANGVNASIGIDVSKYQGAIEWQKVKAEGIEFVIIRLGFRGYGSEGTLNLDANYKDYIKGATEAGLEVGVYFFSQAITDEEAVAEAEYVLSNIEEYHITGPVVFDTEEVKNVDDARTKGLSGEQFTNGCVAFCDRIKTAGYTPMIYFNMVWQAFTLDIERLTSYEKWYADYEPEPQSPYDFSIWQYTETGKVNGIEGNVDFNLWFK